MSGETDQVLWRGVRPVEGISGVWPARNATRLTDDGYKSGSGYETVYTVPANKLCFITTVYLTSRNANAGLNTTYASIRTGGNAHVCYLLQHFYVVAGQISSSQRFFPALELPASYFVRLYNSHADVEARTLIFGWLEDA